MMNDVGFCSMDFYPVLLLSTGCQNGNCTSARGKILSGLL